MPAQPPAPIPPIVFRDFRPGIADNPASNYPPEQATRANTYRCIANNVGSLTPLFNRDFALTGTDFGTPNAATYFLDGVFAAGPVTGGLPVSTSQRFHDLFVATEYNDGVNRRLKIERWRMYEAVPTADLIRNYNTADASAGGNACGIRWGISRANRGAPTSPGIPIVVYAWVPALATIGNGFVEYFPDDGASAVNGVFQVIATAGMIMGVHQGRIVIGIQNGYNNGVGSSWATSEDLRWTAVNNPASLGTTAVVVPENPDGYMFVVSMSANELFALKRSFGVVIQGDLNDPIVINLPMVAGGFDGHSPVVTPQGLVYANRYTGAWLWSHGDTAQLLSPTLDPDFFTLTTLPSEVLVGALYTFAHLGQYVLLSNNWLYDTVLKSWWRIEDTALLQIRHWTAITSFLYGCPSTVADPPGTSVYGWNLTTLSPTYSWQSQPIWQSQDRMLAIREVELVAKGKGTITLTLTATDGTSTTSEVINLANTGGPERFRRNFYIQGYYVQLRIQADSGDTTAAPTVINVTLHPDTRSRVPAA